MELEELDSLSKKTEEILSTLAKLKQEALIQAEASKAIEGERETQRSLTIALEAASIELSNAASVLSSGSLSEELASFDEKLSDLDTKNLDGMKLLDSLGSSQNDILEQAASLASTAKDLGASIRALQSGTNAWVAQNATTAQSLDIASSKTELGVKRIESTTNEIATQVTQATRQCDAIAASAADMARIASDLSQHVSTLQADLATTRGRLDALEAQLAHTNEQLIRAVEQADTNADKLEQVLGILARVDRNTQKGFGKERG